ncbi:unnamed protein product [Lymnaea stagnalis]|uniref:Schlafen AlbA-2 domain-containing protein n=1 Tax=Lymnaea stagnalis TaxID=6523 RepID=A0AAV2H315_LYMST
MQSADVTKIKPYYVKYEIIPYEEDMCHEFKGHKNLCKEELPRFSTDSGVKKGSRKPVSRNLCGFLNTGLGGTVYCGVVDNGAIMGLKLTQYQKDHVVGALDDLMARYKPKVPADRYCVKFLPVLGPTVKEEDRDEMAMLSMTEIVDSDDRKRPHKFRNPDYCWCDIDSKARCENGIILSDYVIEFRIKPWDYDDTSKKGLGQLVNMLPIHADEEGKVYFRHQASLMKYSITTIPNAAYFATRTRCNDIIEQLKNEISLVKSSMEKSNINTKENPVTTFMYQ